MRGNIMFRYGLVSVLFAVLMASQVTAADVRWDNSSGDGTWETVTNWDTNRLPLASDAIKIGYWWGLKNGTAVVSQVGAEAGVIYLADSSVSTTGVLQIVSGELNVNNTMYVGTHGAGSIYMTGGSLLVTNKITLGLYSGGPGGNIDMSGGYMECEEISGSWNSPGKIVQSGGTNIMRTRLQLGYNPNVLAEYELSGGLLDAGEVRICANVKTRGAFTISGGTLDLTGTGDTLGVAYWSTSTGTCTIAGGNITADKCWVGYQGDGTLIQSGGTNSIDTAFLIGGYGGSVGTYSLYGGLLEVGASIMYVSQSIFEQASSGTFLMGNTNGTGILRQKGATTTDIVVRRDAAAADGLIRGWGKVELGGQLVNNGRIIADGYGTDRDLDFTDMTNDLTTVSIVNTTNNGWYAQNHGRLLRPPTHNWESGIWWGGGGAHGMADYKAINSVKFTWSGSAFDSITGILYAGDHGSVPADLVDIIGCWEFSDVANDSELTFIYDAALAADLSIDENDLLIWRHNGTKWIDVTAASGLDTANNTIKTTSVDANAFFAITKIPPAKGTLILIQ